MESSAPVNKPIVIGQISGVFGVHGWVKIFSHTEPRENILNYNPWLIKQNQQWQPMKLLKGRKQAKTLVAQIEGVANREQAHALIGSDISIMPKQLKKLDDNDYYWRELQGLDVINLEGQLLGKIDYMMATGANDVLVVKLTQAMIDATEEKELLIPYLMGEVVKSVDLDKGCITLDWSQDFI